MNKTVITKSASDIVFFTGILLVTIIQTLVLVRVIKERSSLTEVSQMYSSRIQPDPWLVLSAQLISTHWQNQRQFSDVLQESSTAIGLHNALIT